MHREKPHLDDLMSNNATVWYDMERISSGSMLKIILIKLINKETDYISILIAFGYPEIS